MNGEAVVFPFHALQHIHQKGSGPLIKSQRTKKKHEFKIKYK